MSYAQRLIDVQETFARRVINAHHKHAIIAHAPALNMRRPDDFMPNDAGPFRSYLSRRLIEMLDALPPSAACGYLRFLLCCLRRHTRASNAPPSHVDLRDDHAFALACQAVYYYFS
jgi:hypothetical protein